MKYYIYRNGHKSPLVPRVHGTVHGKWMLIVGMALSAISIIGLVKLYFTVYP